MNTPLDWLIAAGVILPSLLVVLGGAWFAARRGPAGEVDGAEPQSATSAKSADPTDPGEPPFTLQL